MPMGTLRIRELSRRDGAQLVDLFRSSFPREMEISGFDVRAVRKSLRLYGVLKVIQRLTRRPFVLFAVGEVEGEVVAAVSLNREKDAWYIGTVMVAPEHRRKGYGRAILEHALEVARTFGGKRAILHVLEDNLPARGLYESAGFRTFERVVHFVREPPEGEEVLFPAGYTLSKIDLFDRQALRLVHAAREPESAEVYGEPEPTPWYIRPLARLQPGIRERYAVVHSGRWVGIYTFAAPFREKGAANASLAILPEHRGQGLEEALLSRALRRAREIGCPRLLTRADERNTALLSACERLGFERLYVMEGMYRDL